MRLRTLSIISTTLLAACNNPECEETSSSLDSGADSVSVDGGTPETTGEDIIVDAAPDTGTEPLPRDPIGDPAAATELLTEHCDERVGEPRVEEVAEGLWVAIGFDLANTMLLETSEGNVVIDVGMSPARSAETRAALEAEVEGDVVAVIYTHSHVDHVGGATAWVGEDTDVWATEAFTEHLIKQYGAFAPAETRRGNRQFGVDVPDHALPCSALGRRADVAAALETGTVVPNQTFTDFVELTFGDVTIELHEAHGETHDQLYVWIPHLEALLPGDNYYAAFPNLYTIRGTSPRPVDDWIASLDEMRAHDPSLLVPSHTVPVEGRAAVRDALTGYRDGIQTIRDAVVRAANAGLSIDEAVEAIALPPHLADRVDLSELYGQIDWSVRALYTNNLGWFDERTELLYPATAAAEREIAMMGGTSAVLAEVERALQDSDPRWAAHLLGKLRDAGHTELQTQMVAAYEALATEEANTNGRGWLMQRAMELDGRAAQSGAVVLNRRLVHDIPVDIVFEVMPSRLDPVASADVETAVRIVFPTTAYTVSVRRGVAEVFEGTPLPGSPPVAATVTTTEELWKEMVLGLIEPIEAIGSGDLSIDNLAPALEFLALFESGFG
jgi:alkyl sulfatase BDS1-like metallo-beta-lactamase superfamily hydrolase